MKRSVFLIVCFMVLSLSHRAAAFIFPEHAEITRLALDQELTAEGRATLLELVVLARSKIPLCQVLTIPFARLPEHEPASTKARCLPFSVLPALAGDHSDDVAELSASLHSRSMLRFHARFGSAMPGRGAARLLEQKPLAWLAFDVAERFATFIDSGPNDVSRLYRNAAANGGRGDESSDSQRRRFFRALDVRLRALDPEYVSRAQGSRAHFQDASVPLSVLLRRAATTGDVDNALAQMLAHHLRSLQLAYEAGKTGNPASAADALLEHAFALHFVQDGFAAGHIGTEHAVTQLDRLRRHDYLNRVGLPVTRVMSVRGCTSAIERPDDDRRCWTAYGDGYLDGPNARNAAAASAQLSMQVAMAYAQGRWSNEKGATEKALLAPAMEGFATPLMKRCAFPAVRHVALIEHFQDNLNQTSSNAARGMDVKEEGPFVRHVYRVHLQEGITVRVEARASNFDATLRVVAATGGNEWKSENASPLEPYPQLIFLVPHTAEYELSIASQVSTQGGPYQLTLERVATKQEPSEEDCEPLLRNARLLDPAPTWLLSDAALKMRRSWSLSDRVALATATLSGAHTALDRVGRNGVTLAAAGAGSTSSAQLGVLAPGLLGDPFKPCVVDPRASPSRVHPLCDTEGTTFRWKDTDAALIRPILASWPGPTATTATVRGEDSFGAGIAGQAIFGAGLAAGLDSQIPWALAPFMFGLGLSVRADTLLPGTRVNRELAGFNLAAFPMALAGVDDTRYALAAFGEVRVPVWTLVGALTSGTSWDLFSVVDVGPTGARMYYSLPSRAPGGDLRYLGWDVEVLNIRLNQIANSARAASIGNAMDTELRLRFGKTRLQVIDDGFADASTWTLAIEIASGYSVFLWQYE